MAPAPQCFAVGSRSCYPNIPFESERRLLPPVAVALRSQRNVQTKKDVLSGRVPCTCLHSLRTPTVNGGVLYSYDPDDSSGYRKPQLLRDVRQPETSATPATIMPSSANAPVATQPAAPVTVAPKVSTPLPLCSAKDVLSLLQTVELPDYCLRAFKESSITGQDIMSMTPDDLTDSRFKLNPIIIRKVLRIPAAWRLMCFINGSDTQTSITMTTFMRFLHNLGLDSAGHMVRLSEVYGCCDTRHTQELSLDTFLPAAPFIADVLTEELGRCSSSNDSSTSSGGTAVFGGPGSSSAANGVTANGRDGQGSADTGGSPVSYRPSGGGGHTLSEGQQQLRAQLVPLLLPLVSAAVRQQHESQVQQGQSEGSRRSQSEASATLVSSSATAGASSSGGGGARSPVAHAEVKQPKSLGFVSAEAIGMVLLLCVSICAPITLTAVVAALLNMLELL